MPDSWSLPIDLLWTPVATGPLPLSLFNELSLPSSFIGLIPAIFTSKPSRVRFLLATSVRRAPSLSAELKGTEWRQRAGKKPAVDTVRLHRRLCTHSPAVSGLFLCHLGRLGGG